jgi:hypothetical protein
MRLSGSARCANCMAAASVRRPRADVTTTAKGGVVRCHES